MVDQIHLENELARFERCRRVSGHFHAFADLRGARLDESAASPENLDRADTTRAPGTKHRLKAEVGDLDAFELACLQNRRSVRNCRVLTVDLKRDEFRFNLYRHDLGPASSLGNASNDPALSVSPIVLEPS